MNRRSTIQRALVLSAVKELRCHATAEDIYSYVSAKYPHVSRGTVYRNLSALSEAKTIRKVEIPHGADCYDHQCHDHYHLRCTKCARVFDVEMEYMRDLEKQIGNNSGFILESHDIVFKGVCLECNKNNERNG